MRGRKPKPTELKVLEGTWRKDRAPKDAPRERSGTPHCPDWFGPDERAEWKKLARQYRAEGRSIQPHEAGIHVNYVVLQVEIGRAHQELRAIEREIAEVPLFAVPDKMGARRDGVLRRLRGLTQEHKALASELGLTPSARSRAGWSTKMAAPEERDPWAEIAAQTRKRD